MMRPIVKAVGLICILAHDHSIVKMKMLFRYSITVVDHKLSVDAAPVLTAAGPFFRDVFHCQIQHLKKAVICRKYGLCFGYFSQLPVKSFDCIGRIDQLSQFLRELEICAEIRPVLYQDFDILGYLLSQAAAKASRASRAASSSTAV